MPKVPFQAKDLARNMAAFPGNYRVFSNREKILPKAGPGEHYIEGLVDMGLRNGDGQYRVVCLVSNKGKVRRKFWSATHYGTGKDARKGKPDFTEFQ